MAEKVNHPDHYGGADNPYEVIKVIEAWDMDFHLGNAVKYIARYGKKEPGPDDLKKAIWYIARKVRQDGYIITVDSDGTVHTIEAKITLD